VARLVAARFERAVHLESDEFFHFIRSGYVEPWKTGSHEQNEVVIRIYGDAARGYAEAGYFTIIDGVILPWSLYDRFRDRLRKAGLEVATAKLRPSLAACTSRAEQRASRLHLADPAVIERLWHEFSDLGGVERSVIDNSALDPHATAEEVIGRLQTR
jgi:hypothetical protein